MPERQRLSQCGARVPECHPVVYVVGTAAAPVYNYKWYLRGAWSTPEAEPCAHDKAVVIQSSFVREAQEPAWYSNSSLYQRLGAVREVRRAVAL